MAQKPQLMANDSFQRIYFQLRKCMQRGQVRPRSVDFKKKSEPSEHGLRYNVRNTLSSRCTKVAGSLGVCESKNSKQKHLMT